MIRPAIRLVVPLLLLLPSPHLTAEPPSKEYRLVWADEFEGTELDRTKWDYRALGPRRDAVNVKETVELDGSGRLRLRTRRSGDRVETAMIGTQGRFETCFGYFECRIRFQREVGHWSAFWLQSPTVGKVGDPRVNGTEIDVIEYLSRYPDVAHINLHWDGYGKEHRHVGTKHRDASLARGFHTIGLEWTPDEYVFYIDGKVAWRSSEAVSHRKQYMILSLEVGKWAGDIREARLPDGVEVDWVRVYKKGERTPARPGPSTPAETEPRSPDTSGAAKDIDG